jgi:hypothetical protein
LQSHDGFDDTVADLKKQFRFIGDTGAYHFLWSVDEPTLAPGQWFGGRGRHSSPAHAGDAG